MRTWWQISLATLLVTLAGCAKKKQAAPLVPPPPVAAPSVRKAPKPRAAVAVPTPEPAPAPPPVRPAMTLESRTDPAIDRGAVENRIRGLQSTLAQLNARNLSASAKDDRDRVASMLDLARKSLAAGDLRQANDISARAESLARTLLNAR